MSSSDCASVLKRGYLCDKKAGILDPKKKWFVLRHDQLMRYCILEFFKDEKSWIKREPPKGFINVQDIVEVIRSPDKKQTLELLCPGVGYRLMANSETEADDWAEAIKRLIVYRKDIRSCSFPQLSPPGGNSVPLSGSPPNHTFNNMSAKPAAPMFSIDGTHNSQNCPHLRIVRSHYPTPPEMIPDTINPTSTSILQKQESNDATPFPHPSPPSSTDSTSMCGSSTSYDSGPFSEACNDTDVHRSPSRFRVNVNDSEKLNTVGDCDLIISDEYLSLANANTGNQIVKWPLGSVRRYGVNNVCFTFECGRYCSTGEGQFFLYSLQSRVIHNQVHVAIMKLNNQDLSTRRGSTPVDPIALRTGSSMIIPIHRVASNNDSLSSPPQYNHIEHHVKKQVSHELYTKLQQTSPSAFSACSSFSTITPPDYEKLSHSPHIVHSSTVPLLSTVSSEGHTLPTQTYPEPVYSTLKEVETDTSSSKEDLEKTTEESSLCENMPPPIPPRLTKMTSI